MAANFSAFLFIFGFSSNPLLRGFLRSDLTELFQNVNGLAGRSTLHMAKSLSLPETKLDEASVWPVEDRLQAFYVAFLVRCPLCAYHKSLNECTNDRDDQRLLALFQFLSSL